MNEATPLAHREKEAQLAHSTLASDMSVWPSQTLSGRPAAN